MSNIVLVTAGGEQHGLVNTLPNSVADNGFKHMKPEHKKECEKQKAEDAKIVKARYINKRGSQERLTKPYCRYAGDPIQIWHLIPGQVYDLPMGLIKEVNGQKGMKRAGLCDESGGNPSAKDEVVEGIHELIPTSF